MNPVRRIAVYGYGTYGKRTCESFRLYWGDAYEVTAIFDRQPAGRTDPCWKLPVLLPEELEPAFVRGTFDAVMICIYHWDMYREVAAWLKNLEIPVFLPGRKEDFGDPSCFEQDPYPDISVSRNHYRFHVYRNMCGAVADYGRRQFLFLFSEAGRVNIDSYRKYLDLDAFGVYLRSYPFRFKDPLPEKIFMEGEWCPIVKFLSNNYWHFTFETADCVYLMEKAGYRGKYICNLTPFAEEMLQLLGVERSRIVSTDELEMHKTYVFEKLYDINHEGLKALEFSAEAVPEMAAVIRAQLQRDDRYPKKLYVSRIGFRKLLNGEEVAVRNGFTVMIPEEHSLREQMEYFYNAEIVLCPHGANSTNFLYMREGTVFAEIFSDCWHKDINADICEGCGVNYLQMTGRKVAQDRRFGMYADYTVDEDDLQRLISRAEKIRAGQEG